jgi:hypothetical protein
MTTRRIRSRALIACLLTGLLPGGAALAQRVPDPQLPLLPGWLFKADGLASVLTFGDPLSVTPYELEAARRDAPRFRKSFDLFRADLMRPMVPAAVAPPATEKLRPPGTVQNVRIVGRP